MRFFINPRYLKDENIYLLEKVWAMLYSKDFPFVAHTFSATGYNIHVFCILCGQKLEIARNNELCQFAYIVKENTTLMNEYEY